MSHRILILEKEGITSFDLKYHLKQNGYSVQLLENADDLQNTVKWHTADAVIVEAALLSIRNTDASRTTGQGINPYRLLMFPGNMLILDKHLNLICSFSKPFNTEILINTITDYFVNLASRPLQDDKPGSIS